MLKIVNTTNLRSHLRPSHHELFDELLVKGREDTEKKAEEGKSGKTKKAKRMSPINTR